MRFVATALARAGLGDAAVDTILMARKVAAEAAFKTLPSGPLALLVTVFTTTGETSESRYARDLGWSEFCRDLAVTPIPGSGRDILHGVGADAVLAALTDLETRLRSPHPAPDKSGP